LTLSYDYLKQRQRAERDNHHINIGLRLHRALSWLNCAEQCVDDDDARFVFLWISFNAAYANEIDGSLHFTEKDVFKNFLKRLCELDGKNRLYELVWSEFPSSIRVLLDNKYVYQPFWDYQNKKITEEDWHKRFTKDKKFAHTALGNKDTDKVLSAIFYRLYTLRNQLMHGGATWNSSTNRDQMRDGANILGKLVPVIIEIMMDNADTVWGEPCYPVVEN